MRILLLLAVILITLQSVNAISYSFQENDTYTVEGTTYTIKPYTSDAVLLYYDNSSRILKRSSCIDREYTKFCLQSASSTTATITETFTGPKLELSHDLLSTSAYVGIEAEGVITVENTGVQPAYQARLTIELPEGLELRDGSRTDTRVFDVYDESSMKYRYHALRNGTYVINATIEYFDKNTTQSVSEPSRTFTASLPFTYSISSSRDPRAGALQVNITKKDSGNFTFVVAAQYPGNVSLTSDARRADIKDNQVSLREALNSTDTKFSLNATYKFSTPPLEPLIITITYENDTNELSFNNFFSFDVIEDPDPSIAVLVDPLYTGNAGLVHIVITGNRAGTLKITGDIFNSSTAVTPGVHEFEVLPKDTGNYTLSVSFISKNSYEQIHEAKGTIIVTVSEPPLIIPDESEEDQSTNTAEPAPLGNDQSNPYLLIAAVAALSLLTALTLAIRSAPRLDNIERVVENISKMAQLLEAKQKKQALNSNESAELNNLRQELERIRKKL